MKMYGVTFGDKHSYHDWGVYLSGSHKSLPEPRIFTVDVPFSNGLLDVTPALSNRIFFKPREITFDFTVIDCKYSWSELYSKIAGAVHGRALKVISDTDPGFYWYAYYCELETPSADEDVGHFSIKCTCHPFKMATHKTVRKYSVNRASRLKDVINYPGADTNVSITCTSKCNIAAQVDGEKTKIVELNPGTYENVFTLINGKNTIELTNLSSSSANSITLSYREGAL